MAGGSGAWAGDDAATPASAAHSASGTDRLRRGGRSGITRKGGRGPALRQALLLCAALSPAAAQAHFFVQPYTLPVPFALYAAGAAVALLLSFVLAGVFAGAPARVRWDGEPRDGAHESTHESTHDSTTGTRGAIGRWVSVGLLALCIASALLGRQNPFSNFSMTFFWIVFVLGVPYAVALLGDFYAALNPWRALGAGLQRLGLSVQGRRPYPAGWGHWPALVLYIAFIWLELFGQLLPRGLGWALLAYTAIQLAGMWWFGRDAWIAHGEFFGVINRFFGALAPRVGGRWRRPLVGLLDERVMTGSGLLFILFMLSSTAFDGLHGTLPWVTLFWKGLYPQLAPWFHPPEGQVYALSTRLYYAWQWSSLVLSPFVYLAVYGLFMALAARVAHSELPAAVLALRFAPTLVPIVFVYHFTHYYTLLLSQAPQLLRLLSDPFGWGWNLFGTAPWRIAPLMIDVSTIWHTQVALIVAGHIASVWLAHVEALRLFGSARRAALSQAPMLVLMLLFTTLGLWILSLPLAPGG